MAERRESFHPTPDEMRRLLAGSGPGWPANLLVASTLDSTSRMARRLVSRLLEDDESVPSFVVVGLHQSGGKGREGRTWWSPPGAGLYATWVATVPIADLSWLPLRVPLALCEALDRFIPGRCRIKWPNDVLVEGRKIGGVLIEAVRRASPEAEVLIGFGVNRSHPTEEMPSLRATSLCGEMVNPPTLAELIRVTLERVGAVLSAPSSPADLLAAFRARLIHQVGETLQVRMGDERIEGRFLGVDDSGFLRLEVSGEEKRIAAGEVVQ